MDFKIAFTDKEITAWGGMVLMKKLIEKSEIGEKLNELELPAQGSNRGYSPLQLIESFWISVWCGANFILSRVSPPSLKQSRTRRAI